MNQPKKTIIVIHMHRMLLMFHVFWSILFVDVYNDVQKRNKILYSETTYITSEFDTFPIGIKSLARKCTKHFPKSV